MARRGLEAGLYNPGASYGEAVGDAAEFSAKTNQLYDAEDRLSRTATNESILSERRDTRAQQQFDMAAQLHPYKLQAAQQEVQMNSLKYDEAARKAKDDAEAARQTQEFFSACAGGTCTPEDMIIKGINISALRRDAHGVAQGMKDLGDRARDKEFAGAQDKMMESSRGLLDTAIKSGKFEDWEALEREINKPEYVHARKSGWYQGITKQIDEQRRRIMPDPARQALVEYRGLLSDPKRKADEAWNEVLRKNEDAAAYYAENPNRVPPEIKPALESRKKHEDRADRLEEIRVQEGERRKTAAMTESMRGAREIALEREREGGRERRGVGTSGGMRGSDKQLTDAANNIEREIKGLQRAADTSDDPERDRQRIRDLQTELDGIRGELKGRRGGGATGTGATGGAGAGGEAPPARGIRQATLREARGQLDRFTTPEQVSRFLARAKDMLSPEEYQHLETEYGRKFRQKK